MNFTIRGLPLDHFVHLLDADDATLRTAGVTVCTADAPHAYPCRITLEDAVPGEQVLLLSHAHQPGPSPYAASGPIFIRRKATARLECPNVVPDQQRRRLLSVRAYDHRDWLVDADIVPGSDLESLIERFFVSPEVAYLHVHNARPGCYACRVDPG